MIRYTLQCAKGHQFEAWFPNSAAYDQQAAAGLLSCAECGSRKVEKSIMAPRIGKGSGKGGHKGDAADIDRQMERAAERNPERDAPGATPPAVAGGPPAPPETPAPAPSMAVSSKLREALHEMKRFVEANAENVGDRFADEARKIHYGESEERNIYGDTSDEEAEELREEGVPFGRIPWPKTGDA